MHRKIWSTAVVGLLVCLSLPASAGKRGAEPETIRQAIAAIDSDRSASIHALTTALQKAKSTDRTWILVHLAEQLRLDGSVDQSRQRFIEARASKKAMHAHEAAQLGLALLDAEQGVNSSVLGAMEDVEIAHGLDTQNADRFLILARRAADGLGGEIQTYVDHATQFASTDVLQAARVAELVAPLAPVEPSDTSDQGNAEHGTPTSLATSPWQAARLALAAGDRDTARAEGLRARDDATNPERLAALDLFDAAVEGADTQYDRIGVLLPLSGRYGSVGARLQEAINFGWAHAEHPQQLVFTDSGGTPETAAEAARTLVVDDGVVALVGPILGVETEAVSLAADAMGVPLLAMSQALDDISALEWVFQGWLTPRQQVNALLDYAMDAQGMASFAIFAPDSDYGRSAADTFTEEVEARGGRIAIRTDYDASTSNHIPFAKVLGQKNPRDEDAVPVLDFEGIFLPDNARNVPIAAAALAYEEFPVGRFTPTKDSQPITLMGLSGWNDHAMIAAGGQYIRDGLFTDVYVTPPKHEDQDWYAAERWTTFDAAYLATTGRHASPLESLAVDIGLLLSATASTSPKTRIAFRDALMTAKPAASATGAIGFDETSRVLRRDIEVLFVKGDGFETAKP
jgi:ABC-type branched-subunit amino acid transport system substrate-binding protein